MAPDGSVHSFAAPKHEVSSPCSTAVSRFKNCLDSDLVALLISIQRVLKSAQCRTCSVHKLTMLGSLFWVTVVPCDVILLWFPWKLSWKYYNRSSTVAVSRLKNFHGCHQLWCEVEKLLGLLRFHSSSFMQRKMPKKWLSRSQIVLQRQSSYPFVHDTNTPLSSRWCRERDAWAP